MNEIQQAIDNIKREFNKTFVVQTVGKRNLVMGIDAFRFENDGESHYCLHNNSAGSVCRKKTRNLTIEHAVSSTIITGTKRERFNWMRKQFREHGLKECPKTINYLLGFITRKLN